MLTCITQVCSGSYEVCWLASPMCILDLIKHALGKMKVCWLESPNHYPVVKFRKYVDLHHPLIKWKYVDLNHPTIAIFTLHQGQLRSMVGYPSTWLEINPSRLDFQPLVRNPTAGWYSTHWMVRIPTILPLCIKSITSPPNCWHVENVSEIKSESGSKASDLHPF